MFHDSTRPVIHMRMSKQSVYFQFCVNVKNEAPGAPNVQPLWQIYTCPAASGHTLYTDMRALHHKPCSSLVCHSLYYTSKVIPAEQLMDLDAQTWLPLKHESLCQQNKQQSPSRTLQTCDIPSITLDFLPCLTAPSRHLADPQRTQLLSLCGQVAAVMHVGPSLSCTTPADNSSKNNTVFWQQEVGTMHSTAAFLAFLRSAAGIDLHSHSQPHMFTPHHGCRCSTESCAMHA